MKSDQVITYLKNADSFLITAGNEVNRPSEDAVTLCTCQCTRRSVTDLLRSFLADRNYTDLAENNLESLFKECKKADPDFSKVDISCFACQKLDNNTVGGYCLDMDTVNECFAKAKEIREFVLKKLKLNPEVLR